MALCLGLAGCATFGKKPASSQNPGARNGADQGAALPTDRIGQAPPPDRSAPPPGFGAILAGQVIDSFNRRPAGPVYIQVVEPPAANSPAPAPIEVATDSQGYFTIQGGLQVGHHYQLIARTKNGERVMAGATWATPPDPKILIRVSEDLATPNTPPVPASLGVIEPRAGSVGDGPPPGTANGQGNDRAWAPGRGAAANPNGRPADLGAPVGVPGPPSLPPAPGGADSPLARPESIAGDNRLANNGALPTNVPPQMGPNPFTSPSSAAVSTGPAQVPSCVLTGQTLYNFALNDLNGQSWEYRRDHRGRLVLIDFWGTWCVHCLHAIPHLNILQQRYGRYGLEVVGVAYEDGTALEQVQKVNRVRQRLEINYRLLMGSDRLTCPVRTQFAVSHWPTLVLLDENGRIIWRGEGLEGPQIRELENVIKQRLGVH
jgi:thiol-disulfide isomerase/thioredoxin